MSATIARRSCWFSFITAAIVMVSPLLAQEEIRPVRIIGGQVSGKKLANGITAYLGIPFAAPPANELSQVSSRIFIDAGNRRSRSFPGMVSSER